LNLRHKIFVVLTVTFFVQISLFAQLKYYTSIVADTMHINFNNNYSLMHVGIIPHTETITLRDSVLDKDDYKIDYKTSTFQLSKNLVYSLFDTLIVRYLVLNLGLKKEYQKHRLVFRYNNYTGDTVRTVISQSTPFTIESIFGSGIRKSGTIVRGFTVGTTKDFSLNSGLRLQLSGKLSNQLEIVAALTDQNTPIQPEGNTARLDELDRVFIQVKHPNVTGTFGDYMLQENYGEFGKISRKLQGLLGEFHYKGNKAYFAVASSKGKFTTNNFNGSDGVQGPYQLTGTNNEPNIIVIAGTEHVYIDGIEMKRGERYDYIIDYSNAQITFTPNKLITSASRISVDFQYTGRKYERNFFGAGIKSNFFNKKLGIQIQYLRAGDNQDAPIDISLTAEDKKILSQAGNDRFKAVRPGVTLAKPDSLGVVRGLYERVDTLIHGTSFFYYKYNPGGIKAIYNATFSFVGYNMGNYIRESLGRFKFVGLNKGSYNPVILLPLPELKQLGNFVLDVSPIDGFEVRVEYAASLWDKNRFSNIDDNKDFGYARDIFVKMNPKQINIANISLGKIGFSYKDRFVQSRFTSLDRYNAVEFNRDYNIESSLKPQNQTLREINLNLIPSKKLSITSSYGYLKEGNNFNSNRFNNTLYFSDNNNYKLEYNLDYVSSANLNANSYWLRQKGHLFYKFGKFKPGLGFLTENKRDKQINTGSLLSSSLKYYEVDPFIELINLSGVNLKAQYSFRNDYLPVSGIMNKESWAVAQTYELRYNGLSGINSTINVTFRNKKYTRQFKNKGYLNNQTILVRSQNRLNLWKPISGSIYYEVSTQKTAKLQRIFIQVKKGAGNYVYLGDLNHNGIKDENEFEPAIYDGNYIEVTVPTNKLYPVIDLKMNTRWKIEYGRMFDHNTFIGKILKPVSSETYWRVEEDSREEDYKKIYLLDFSAFQNPAKTINGFNYIQQDLFLYKNNPEFSMRFRYSQKKSMNQYSAGIERNYNRERSIRITFRLIPEISNRTDIINRIDNVSASTASNRVREITSNKIISDFSYRPERDIEVGFKFQVGRSIDDDPVIPTIINMNSQSIRFTLSLAGRGRLRAEFERNELTENTNKNFLPFELTQGNVIGKNYFWSINFNYKLSDNLQSTLSYVGRLQGGERVVHTARAEVRAYF